VAKDRARPFSPKHRRYWIPVTGGMILIGVINVTIGYCTYDPAPEHEFERLRREQGTIDAGAGDASVTPVDRR
jgi:hypothetical protein